MNSFESNTIKAYGKYGEEWLVSLPSIIHKLTRKWQLSGLAPLNNLSYHYVLGGWQNNLPIILKLAFNIPSLQKESAALKVFHGYGAVKVLAESDGALLLERILPGTSIKSFFPIQDLKAIEIVCEVISKLHMAPLSMHNEFPHIKQWFKVFDKQWPVPSHYLGKAIHLKNKLIDTMTKPVLLHADLHHENILQNNSYWTVIDPHGVIGEPAYEVAAFIRNPIPELLAIENSADIITSRIITFSKILNLDPKRIQNWCFVQAILAWVWSIEDGTDTINFKKLTEIFDNLDI